MAQYTILPSYNIVTSDNINYTVQMSTDPRLTNIHAIQIIDDYIHVEFNTGEPVKWDAAIADYQDIIDEVETQKNVVTPAPTLEASKETTRKIIRDAFYQQLKAGLTVNNILMNAQVWDIQILQSAVTNATNKSITTLDVVDFNNVIHPGITLTDVNTMINELLDNFHTLFAKKQSLRVEIENAETIADLQKIVW